MVPLTGRQAQALAAIRAAWPDSELLLIGALALGQHISMAYRDTDDVDLAVAMSIEEFPGPMASMEGWTRDAKMERRFFSPQRQMVDILPAGGKLITTGYIDWPSGHRMSLVGFDLAFAHSTKEQAGMTEVLVPSAPVLAFLKMRAWLDRPADRPKDLQDIAYLLCEYIGDDDDRRFEDDLFDLELDFQDVSPFALGRDLGRIVQSDHIPHVEEFLAIATPEKLAAYGPACWHSADHAEQALHVFDRGFKANDDPLPE